MCAAIHGNSTKGCWAARIGLLYIALHISRTAVSQLHHKIPLPGVVVMKAFHSTLQPPFFTASCCSSPRQTAASSRKSRCTACCGDRQWRQLPGASCWDSRQKEVQTAVWNRKPSVDCGLEITVLEYYAAL